MSPVPRQEAFYNLITEGREPGAFQQSVVVSRRPPLNVQSVLLSAMYLRPLSKSADVTLFSRVFTTLM